MSNNVLDMTIDELYPSPFLKAADLNGDTTLTITDLSMEKMGQSNEEKLVLYFRELVGKSLVLNKTNSKTIGKLYGSRVGDWRGKRITLFPTDVSFRGDMVPTIRIRPVVPASAPAGAAVVSHQAPAYTPPPPPENFPD